MKSIRSGLVVALVAALSLMTPTPASAADTVTVAGQTRTLNGTNIYRSTDYLVLYTPAKGATTGTNQYGFEAEVIGGKVTKVQDGVGNMAIPSNGVVLSGHGTSRTWLRTYATIGANVTLPGGTPPPPPPTGGTQLLPDVGIRTLRNFTIVNTGGRKLLKFPAVTANIGDGPLEVRATRSSSTSTDWSGKQIIFKTDGTKDQIQTSLQFYYAGDGHNHFHMRDFDAYEIFNPSGMKLRDGEKHGFCFEDNTGYRDWPGRVSGSPANPVYTHATSCGEAQPSTTSIVHGLSKGWGDTYPTSLPDQAIDITGLADGTYQVKVTADRGGWIKEKNESNNFASAQVRITGNTVTLLSATNGL